MLKLPPIKPNKLPDELIYKSTEKVSCSSKYETAHMFSVKNGRRLGDAEFYKSNAYRGEKVIPSVYVNWLITFERGKNYGTKLLNYIKNYSHKVGCQGYFHLASSANISPQKAPHTFYRKYGMTSDMESTDKKLDKYIQKGKIPTMQDMEGFLMFYPPIKKESHWEKLIKKLKF